MLKVIGKDIVNRNYEIGQASFALDCNDLLQSFALGDIYSLKSLLTNDVLFYFPDHDGGRRRFIKGNTEVLNFWHNWRKLNKACFIAFNEINSITVDVAKKIYPVFTSGTWVFTWQSLVIQYEDQRGFASLNINFHFDSFSKIDQIVTYYDVQSLNKRKIMPFNKCTSSF